MASITLNYNPRNKAAAGIIDVIRAMDGVFKIQSSTTNAATTRKAMKEALQGEATVCEDWQDYLKKTGADA